MKLISKKRHEGALQKELRFWKKDNILESQEFRTRRYLEPMRRCLEQVKTGEVKNILDVGCGPACLIQHIAAGEKWYLDPLLNDYRELFGDSIPAGHYIPTGVEAAELDNAFFDYIVSLNAFDHVQNPWQALRDIYVALKPGGVFLFSIYVRGKVLAFLRNLSEYAHLSTDSAHPYTFTKESMERELRNVSFTILKTELIDEEPDRREYLWVCRKER